EPHTAFNTISFRRLPRWPECFGKSILNPPGVAAEVAILGYPMCGSIRNCPHEGDADARWAVHPLLHRRFLSGSRHRHAGIIGGVGPRGCLPARPDLLSTADGQ